MNHSLKGCILCILAIILFGCEADNLIYKKGFPEENSPALTKFIQHYFTGLDYELMVKEDTYIYSNRNLNSAENKITYFEIPLSEIEQYYQPLLTSANPFEKLHNLFEDKEKLYHETTDDLPVVTKEKGNILKLEMLEESRELSLPKVLGEGQISKSDEVIINMVSNQADGFILKIEDDIKQETYYLFALKDLSKIDVYPESSLENQVEKGALKLFYPILQKIGVSKDYVELPNGLIIDINKDQIKQIKKVDLRSEDSSYIYLGGAEDPLRDGIQRIQTIENYFLENDVYEAEFKLSYKNIAKEMDLHTGGISTARIDYFDKDFAVFSLNYKGVYIGAASSVNVIIDLQNNQDNKLAYLVDLEL